MEIKKGKIMSAQKVVFYAPEGFGKSTFASQFPDPLYIDTEGGTKQLDVQRFDEDMSKWEKILEAVDYVIANPDCCKTLVIDTIDWAEMACITKLNKDHNTANILTMDYGKGSQFVQAEVAMLLVKLDAVIKRGIHVVLLAHAIMRKLEVPEEMGAFDHWELKLQSKQVKAMIKEWADLLLFGNYKTYVITDDKTKSKKAQGGKRVIFTEHHACWDAKNRHNLPPEIPFEYKSISGIFEKKEPSQGKERAEKATKVMEPVDNLPKKEKPEPKPEEKDSTNKIEAELRRLMNGSKLTEDEVIFTFHEKKLFMDAAKISDITDWAFIESNVIGKWQGFSKAVKKYGGDCPFVSHWADEHKEEGKKK